MNGLLNKRLRKFVVDTRKEGADIPALKAQALKEIYSLIASCFGLPPKEFTFEYVDASEKHHAEYHVTPAQFYENYLGADIDDYINCINAPTSNKEYYKTYTVEYLGNVVNGNPINMLNLPLDEFKNAAIEQLKINGEKQGVEVFAMGDKNSPVDIAKAAIEHAAKNGNTVVILDTAGRLHVDEDMMQELAAIKENVDVAQTILVVDAMTGQDAVNVAGTFDEKIGIDGVILTKLDGDTRGGAALSIRAVTGKPILYAGMGEKLSDLEQFHPDRMASRILGMGDVLTLIEKAQEEIDEDKAREMEKKLKKAEFGFDDYLESMNQMKKMGGLSSILSMMPGIGGSQIAEIENAMDEKKMARIEGIIYSMTPQERANPSILNPSRKRRVANGAGVDISEVNRLVKQFEQSRKLMKQMPGMMGAKGGKRGRFKFPF